MVLSFYLGVIWGGPLHPLRGVKLKAGGPLSCVLPLVVTWSTVKDGRDARPGARTFSPPAWPATLSFAGIAGGAGAPRCSRSAAPAGGGRAHCQARRPSSAARPTPTSRRCRVARRTFSCSPRRQPSSSRPPRPRRRRRPATRPSVQFWQTAQLERPRPSPTRARGCRRLPGCPRPRGSGANGRSRTGASRRSYSSRCAPGTPSYRASQRSHPCATPARSRRCCPCGA